MTRRDWLLIGGIVGAVVVGIQCFPSSQPMDGFGLAEATERRWERWHKRAYAEVATCLGYDPTFPRGMKLYVVDGFTAYAGMYSPKPRAIFIRRESLSDTALFKHEFVHHLETPVVHGPLYADAERCGFTPHPAP